MGAVDMLAYANIASEKSWQRLTAPDSYLSAISYNMADEALTLFDRLMAVKPAGLSPNAWTVRAGLSRSALADIKRRGNASWDTMQKLLSAIGVTQAEFEAGHRAAEKDPPPAAVQAPRLAFRGDDRPRDVPVLGTAECADLQFAGDTATVWIETMMLDDEVVDHVRRPASLDNRRDVYAIYFSGTSLEPRYEPGEVAYVDPKRAPKSRDYVVVQLRKSEGDGERIYKVLCKRLLKATPTFVELEQFNPAIVFRVDRKDVAHMHRIIPWEELVAF
jgi:hypothetical protein